MKGIKFTAGEVKKFNSQLFELTLFNNGVEVYSGHIDLDAFMSITTKHRNIKIII